MHADTALVLRHLRLEVASRQRQLDRFNEGEAVLLDGRGKDITAPAVEQIVREIERLCEVGDLYTCGTHSAGGRRRRLTP